MPVGLEARHPFSPIAGPPVEVLIGDPLVGEPAAKQADSGDELTATMRERQKELAPVTVFELRGGLVQDVLPPSIHPDTGKPYFWRTPPSADGLPELPREEALAIPDIIRTATNLLPPDLFPRPAVAAALQDHAGRGAGHAAGLDYRADAAGVADEHDGHT